MVERKGDEKEGRRGEENFTRGMMAPLGLRF